MRFFFGMFMFTYLGASIFVVLHMMDVLRPFRFRYALMAVYILIAFSMMIGRGFGQQMPLFLSMLLTRLGYMWIGLLTYSFVWSLVWLVLRLFHIGPVANRSRLIFFGAEVLVCLLLLLIGNFNAYNVKVTRHQIPTTKNINLRVVQLSDTHLGFQNTQKQMSKIVDKVNEINPDIVFITGDFLENESRIAEIKNMGSPIHRLNPVYGVWAVNGNHEFISGIDNSVRYINSLGINLLRDSTVVIDDDILLIGQEDLSIQRRTQVSRKPIDELIMHQISDDTTVSELIPQKYTIVLSHQIPNHKPYENLGFDLVLSGHTHHGQFFPFNLIVQKMYDIGYGLQKRGNSYFYVTSGTGIWGPAMRIGTVSEIVVFEIGS